MGSVKPRLTFWPLCRPYVSTAAISLSSLYARALGTMLCRSSWLGACSDSARLTPGKSSLSCASRDRCEHVTATDVITADEGRAQLLRASDRCEHVTATDVLTADEGQAQLLRAAQAAAHHHDGWHLKKSRARTAPSLPHGSLIRAYIVAKEVFAGRLIKASAKRIKRLQKLMTEKVVVSAAQLGHPCSHNHDIIHTCRMRGMMPTVEMVTLERLSPNSAGWTIVRVAVRTCS